MLGNDETSTGSKFSWQDRKKPQPPKKILPGPSQFGSLSTYLWYPYEYNRWIVMQNNHAMIT